MALNSEKSVVLSGASNVFTCRVRTPEVVEFVWLINNTVLTDNLLAGVTTHLVPGTVTIGILNFDSVDESYNDIPVQCRANFASGMSELSIKIKLLVQGQYCR